MSAGRDPEAPRALFWRIGGLWLALMALLTLTVSATFLPIGPVKGPVNLAVSFAKAAIIVWFFMQLRRRDGLVRVAALAAAAWLVILFGAVTLDLLTRGLG